MWSSGSESWSLCDVARILSLIVKSAHLGLVVMMNPRVLLMLLIESVTKSDEINTSNCRLEAARDELF